MPRKPAEPGVDRRQQILEAALSVFAERGFEAATNKEIADQAGVQQGLIYFYFKSKADLFFAAFDHHAHRAVAQLDAVFERRHGNDPVTGLGELLAETTTILKVNHTASLVRMMFQVQTSRAPDRHPDKERLRRVGILPAHLTLRLHDYFDEWVANGKLRPVNTWLVASMITKVLISPAGGRSKGDWEQPSQAELVETLTSVFCYGLLPRDDNR